MKRWPVKFDGSEAGFVYAETRDAARRAARAGYKRIHPDRDPTGRVRVGAEGEDVASEAGEARKLVSEVYEGLRLLPGMEAPAEKLRNAVVLLETAVARDGVDAIVGPRTGRGGGGGDTELGEALEPVVAAEVVPGPVKAQLRGLLEWVGVNTADSERRKVEGRLFQTLWEARLVDPAFAEEPACPLYAASAFLVRRLRRAGAIAVERFEGARDVDRFRTALQPYGTDAAELAWAFVPAADGPEPVELRRPLVQVGGRLLQRARLVRGVGHDDEQVVALDGALFDALDRLRSWSAGLGVLADPLLSEKQRQLLERTEARIEKTRRRMAEAAREGADPLPPETARRDLVKFLVDQVHRIEDALAMLPDRSLRDAFGELVFKDVVFRGAGAYLSQRFGIHVDTEVVEGADTQALVGRFRKEPGGPRPKEKSTRIHSVVVPCYTQDGVAVRPAAVRIGIY